MTWEELFSLALEVDTAEATVTVRGEVDVFTFPRLRDVLDGLAGAGQPVSLDLSEVPFVDQRSIAALVELAGSYQKMSTTLVVRRPAPQFLRLAKIVDPDATLAIEPG
jgi:anti-anti-sigma factor